MLTSIIHVHCPHYYIGGDKAKLVIRDAVKPLIHFIPSLLRITFYWNHQKIGLDEHKFSEFRVVIEPKETVFNGCVKNNSGTYAAMTVEQLISGCPAFKWGNDKKNVSKYRQLCAGRIFMFREVPK